MTRSLKTFMKAKKPMWNCGECKCVTLQCWRNNDEFCNCGTSSPEDPDVVVAEFENMLKAQTVETFESWFVEDPQEDLPVSITYDGKTRNFLFRQTSENSGEVLYDSLTYEYAGSITLETEGGEITVVFGEFTYVELEENG